MAYRGVPGQFLLVSQVAQDEKRTKKVNKYSIIYGKTSRYCHYVADHTNFELRATFNNTLKF